jgi:hypothetical protein
MSAAQGLGAATNIAGGEISGWAAMLSKWAMQDAFQREAQRQAAYQGQALGAFNKGLGGAGVDTAQSQLAQGMADRMQRYAQVGAVPLGFGGHVTPRDQAQSQLIGQQRAKLGSYQDWGLQQALQQMQTGRQLNQIGNFAAGTAGVFPYRMYKAQHSQDTLAAIGAAISSIGGSTANYASLLGSQPPSSGSGGGGGGGGYGQGQYAPQGSAYPAYGDMGGFTDAYGVYYPRGWNTLGGGYEGTYIPG